MTEWMAWALVLMIGTFGTLWIAVREIEGGHGPAELTLTRRWLIGTIVATSVVFALYLLLGETWVP